MPSGPREKAQKTSTDPGFFSTASSFPTAVGQRVSPGEVAGYYFDFRFKAVSPEFPPPGLRPWESQIHAGTIQWAIGCYERFLMGEGEEWLKAALEAGNYLLEHQHRGGPQDGAWLHGTAMWHTYRLEPPWISAMAQGEGASILIRLHRETGQERYAEAARRALKPLAKLSREGGVRALLDGGPFFEEYPTDPPSFVLNGGIFALWGCYDAGVGLEDAGAAQDFAEGVETLARNVHRWDTGHWSLYDLYPHPVPNVASSAYHAIHTAQLRGMQLIAPHREFDEAIDRFESYSRSRLETVRAFGRKGTFRVVIPRNHLLAHQIPWSAWRQGQPANGGRRSQALILSYHAVSPDWPSDLAVSPDQLRQQLQSLLRRGYRGATFADAVRGEGPRKPVVVTFDDGFRSVFEHALPVLSELGLPGTIFVPTDFVGGGQMSWPGIEHWVGTAHGDELTCVTWEELRRLRAAGWEVGSHTRSHPVLPQLAEQELTDELVGSREVCARELGVPCRSLAYPFGAYDERVRAGAREAGYQAAATDRPGELNVFSWPRIGVSAIDTPTRFLFKTSAGLRRARNTRAARLLERQRRGRRPAAT
jgi:heparosan-N-sulfate-glucuronate 5-epimerase